MYKFIGFLLGCVVVYVGGHWFVSYQIESGFRNAAQRIDLAALQNIADQWPEISAVLQDITSDSIATNTTIALTSANGIEDTNIDVVESDLAQEADQKSEIPPPLQC